MANVGDVEAMSNYAVSLLQNDEKLQQMKEAAYKQACLFDISNIVPVYEQLYKQYCRTGDC